LVRRRSAARRVDEDFPQFHEPIRSDQTGGQRVTRLAVVETLRAAVDGANRGPRKNLRIEFLFSRTVGSDCGDVRAGAQIGGAIKNVMAIACGVVMGRGFGDNARAALIAIDEFGSLDTFLWRFVGGHPLCERRRGKSDVPATTPLSERLSKELRRRGFRFVGSTICYAFMQATGMVNDHIVDCFRHLDVQHGVP